MSQPGPGISVGNSPLVAMGDAGSVWCLTVDVGKVLNERTIVTVTSLGDFLDHFKPAVALPNEPNRRFTEKDPPSVATIARWLLESNKEYQALSNCKNAIQAAPASISRQIMEYLLAKSATLVTS